MDDTPPMRHKLLLESRVAGLDSGGYLLSLIDHLLTSRNILNLRCIKNLGKAKHQLLMERETYLTIICICITMFRESCVVVVFAVVVVVVVFVFFVVFL